MDIKYTPAGKKVSVIGKINSTEYIVQEIYVTEAGDEIPSGENFTTKTLLDEPAKTWQKKELERYEANREKLAAQVADLQKEIAQLKHIRKNNAEFAKSTLKSIENLPTFDWDYFSDVISGNIKWAVPVGYGWYQPKLFDKTVLAEDSFTRDSWYREVKLLTVAGKSDGDLSYWVGRYSDGSGYSDEYKFFRNDSELKSYLMERMEEVFEEGKLGTCELEGLSKHITIPEHIVDTIYEREKELAAKNYDNNVKNAEEARNRRLEVFDKLRGDRTA